MHGDERSIDLDSLPSLAITCTYSKVLSMAAKPLSTTLLETTISRQASTKQASTIQALKTTFHGKHNMREITTAISTLAMAIATSYCVA